MFFYLLEMLFFALFISKLSTWLRGISWQGVLSFVTLIIASDVMCLIVSPIGLCVSVCMYVCAFLYPQLPVQPFAHTQFFKKFVESVEEGSSVLLWKYFPDSPERGTTFTQWFHLHLVHTCPTENVPVWKTAQYCVCGCFGPHPVSPKVHFHACLLLEGLS